MRSARRLSHRRTAQLGKGMHLVHMEMSAGAVFRVRTISGETLDAQLADGVDSSFAEECLRSKRMMIAIDGRDGVEIVGALQTSSPVVHEQGGAVTIRGREVRLVAERELTLDAGATSMRLESAGAIRLEGDRITIDMATLIRMLAMQCEVP